MQLDELKLFAAVAQLGSFAAVAKRRNVDPSSISRTIAHLEAELGVRLFQRTTRRMSITEAGDLYLSRVLPLIEEMEKVQAEAAGVQATPTGTLRLTASVTFGQTQIAPHLAEFHRRYPELRVECLFNDTNLDLIADRIDLAIRLAPALEGNVVAAKLMDTRYRVVASPQYLKNTPAINIPADLSEHRCLLFNLRNYQSSWLFRSHQGEIAEIAIDGDITLSPAGALRDAAVAGLGPALLPDWLVDEDLKSAKLIDLFPRYAVTATSFDTAAWIVYPSRAFLPAKVRVMIDFLRERYSRLS